SSPSRTKPTGSISAGSRIPTCSRRSTAHRSSCSGAARRSSGIWCSACLSGLRAAGVGRERICDNSRFPTSLAPPARPGSQASSHVSTSHQLTRPKERHMQQDKVLRLGKPCFYVVGLGDDAFANLQLQMVHTHPRAVVRVIRGRKSRTVRAFFDEVSAALQFPYYFGENWAAFDECITDLDWLAGDAYLL